MLRPWFLAVSLLFVWTALGWTFGVSGLQEMAAALGIVQMSGAPVAVSSGELSEHDIDHLNASSPQGQVMLLLERAMNHYDGALEEIEKRLGSWKGQIHPTPEFDQLSSSAYFSSDLRVRAATLEIWLVKDGIEKSAAQVDALIRRAETDEHKAWALANLGALGNRGIERQRVFDTLARYARDPNSENRSAAVNGLGMLGTEDTIPVLLHILRNDPGDNLRDFAACNIADSGMLSRASRQKAVPELIRFLEDRTLDDFTRKEVLQALREITGNDIGDDSVAWITWYSRSHR